MTKEELLRPRYKVIADYPQPPFEDGDQYKFIAGDILLYLKVNNSMTFRRVGRCGGMSVGVPCIAHPEKYPKIFKKLEWWEERLPEDMPEYVQSAFGKHEVLKVDHHFKMHDENEPGHMHVQHSHFVSGERSVNYCFYNPATEQEYSEYIKSQS